MQRHLSEKRMARNLKPSVIYHIALHQAKATGPEVLTGLDAPGPVRCWTVMIPKAVRSLGVGNDKRQGQGQ